MNKLTIIQSVIDRLGAHTYLEIGVQKAKNFYKVKAPFKIAIDPAFRLKMKRKIWYLKDFRKNHFFEMTSDDFFNSQAPEILKDKKIDVAFIDGLHTYEQSFRDFENCMKYLAPNGIILFHDCNPVSREAAEAVNSPKEMKEKYPEKSTYEWNGDVWKSIVRLRSLHPELEVFTFDCDYGVAVVRRKKPKERLDFTEENIQQMSYDDLRDNREKFLNLKSPSFLHEYVLSLR